jgi:hypothetical protein
MTSEMRGRRGSRAMRRVWPTPMSSFHRVVESGRDLKRSRLRIDRADARVCKQAAYHLWTPPFTQGKTLGSLERVVGCCHLSGL